MVAPTGALSKAVFAGNQSSPSNRYPIPAKRTRVEIKIKNSVFITTAEQVRTVKKARAFIDEMRHEFSDATHNVYAFRVGYGSSVTEGMTDDGEPSGTAGRPALTVLRGADIGDIAIVITRYFGGTKLGTGGLVKAYTESAQEVLSALPLSERIERRVGVTAIPYNLFELMKRLIDGHKGEIIDEEFAVDVTVTFRFTVDRVDSFTEAFREMTHGKLDIIWEETTEIS